jgi:hypothetical protein
MARRNADLPKAPRVTLSKTRILEQLSAIDNEANRRERVLRLETAFLRKIDSHILALPAGNAEFRKFSTNPYVLLIHARKREYSKISELESSILPAKEFSSMETSAGRMIEEVVLGEYGWVVVESEMHTANSALDGKKQERDNHKLVTLKSGPRCLNDEMSENFADAIIGNYQAWARESNVQHLDFTYGVLYGTKKQSNKKDWHILRKISEKIPNSITTPPSGRWGCSFDSGGIHVDVTIRIGLDWWNYLSDELCFVEVFTALIRACIRVGVPDQQAHAYIISDLSSIVSLAGVNQNYNVSLLQRNQLPWLFLMARHFCDVLAD